MTLRFSLAQVRCRLAAVGLYLMALPVSAAAQHNISTVSAWDGTTSAPILGRDVTPATVGQTFTAPTGVDALTGFSLFLGYAPLFGVNDLDLRFYAYVFGWGTTGPTTELWRSALQVGETDVLLAERSFSTAIIPVTAGQQYVVFLSTLEADPFDPLSSCISDPLLPCPAYQNIGFVEADVYGGGSLVQSLAGSFDELTASDAWLIDPNGDLAVTLQFRNTGAGTPPGTSVPEPPTLSLLAAALVVIAARRHRRAGSTPS
jgi:hypothetical protein